ncbi:SDR family oxidoreductase [Nocardioides sp. GXQ0305]|jgi:NAD(P)-dependent dehydrogenase (short-subunit alcohol dehydrogenase family)|uniref:SDR family oxidoreductase n=1 Tax=Nocardioides sp. GXQ0305 TaxID=3423912 RepID=UPI003D7D348C
MTRPVILVIGAGPGVSGSVARRFARDGHDVGLVGVHPDVLRDLADDLAALDATAAWRVADLTDHDAATRAVAELAGELGRVDVLHFNPSAFREQDPLELSVPDLLADVTLGVGALLTVLQAARPHMESGARVTATGSMAADQPWHRAASLGVQKAGLRNLVRSIDATLEPDGIRAASVTVRGTLSDHGPFTPDRVADAIHAAAQQDAEFWSVEIPYEG